MKKPQRVQNHHHIKEMNNSSGELPMLAVRFTTSTNEFVTTNIEISSRGWTFQEARQGFDHALEKAKNLKSFKQKKGVE